MTEAQEAPLWRAAAAQALEFQFSAAVRKDRHDCYLAKVVELGKVAAQSKAAA